MQKSGNNRSRQTNQAYINLQLEIILTAFLENTQSVKLEWHLLDRCLRCLLHCCLRRKPTKAEVIQNIRRKCFSSCRPVVQDAVRSSKTSSKEEVLNVLFMRWECTFAHQPGRLETVYFDLLWQLRHGTCVDLINLLECAAQASIGLRRYDDNRGLGQGLIVRELFASFGVTPAVLVERFRRTNEHSACVCALWLSEALGASGEAELGEAILLEIVEIWTIRWRCFTVANKEQVVTRLLQFAHCIVCGRRKDFDRSIFWCDTAFRINNINTAFSKTEQLSLRACFRATLCLRNQCLSQTKRSLHEHIRPWLCRLLLYIQSGDLTHDVCEDLQRSILNLLAVSVILNGVDSPMTMLLAKLGVRSSAMCWASPIYTSRLTLCKILLILIGLTSAARTLSELNLPFVKRFCRLAAWLFQDRGIRKEGELDSLLRSMALWNRLTEQWKCFLYGWAVVLANQLQTVVEPKRMTALDSNPFLLTNKEQAETDFEASKPSPAVFRIVVDVFVSELRGFGKHRPADVVVEIFKSWPSQPTIKGENIM